MSDRLIILPPKERITIVGGGEVPAPAPPTPPPQQSLFILDVATRMPRNANGGPNATGLKTSLTYHWLGGNYSREAGDSESVAYLTRVAYDHIRRNWGSTADPAYGDGIMYHEAIAPTGTVIVLRDYTEALYHAGNENANRVSRAILVMCGPDTPPTDAQRKAIRMRWEDFGRIPVHIHSDWSPTQCPGPEVTSLVRSLRV